MRRAESWRVLVAGLLALLASGAPADPPGYELGRGLRLPALDLTLAGYASARARDLEQRPPRFDLHDLSLFIIWSPTARWTVFSEIELEDVVTVDQRGPNASDTELVVERLYADYAVDGRFNLRAGRWLTPFGRWNLLHADPLVWTVTRPLVTSLAIPDHGTGVMAYGSVPIGADSVDYSLYLDDSAALDPVDAEASFEEFDLGGLANNFDQAAGALLRYRFLALRAELGLSWASFSIDRQRGHQHAIGVDGIVHHGRFELSSELVYRVNTRAGVRDDWGGFIQAVAPLVDTLYGVGRVEFYSSGLIGDDAGRTSAGLAWRPHRALVFKLEYHDGTNARILPDGWEVSCGVLF
ncbi:MAG: hypothetical protein RLW62_06540 [Gammaproteobacteria bacterium]